MANTREISQEEEQIKIYFNELQKNGFIKEIKYQPEPIILFNKVEIPIIKQLKTKSKTIFKTLLNERIYTPDFLITWNDKNIFHEDISNYSFDKFPYFFSYMNKSYIEVKSDNRFDNNMTRLFTSRTQPWVWQKHKIFINLVKVPEIFKDTFIPDEILHDFYYKVNTKNNKKGDKKFKWNYNTLQSFLG